MGGNGTGRGGRKRYSQEAKVWLVQKPVESDRLYSIAGPSSSPLVFSPTAAYDKRPMRPTGPPCEVLDVHVSKSCHYRNTRKSVGLT